MSNDIPIIITVSDKDAISKLDNVKKAIDDLKTSAGSAGSSINNSFTQAFASVNASATKVTATYQNNFNQINNTTIKVTNNMKSAFNKTNSEIGASTKGMLSQLLAYAGKVRSSLGSAMKSFNQQDTAPRFFTSLTGSASLVGSVVTAFTSGAKAAYELGNSFYAAENGLKAITGSGEAAKESMAFISSEADRLGQDVLTLSQSYTKLAAAGAKSSLTTAQIRDVFSSLSETATILQFDAQKTEGAFRALTQMLSKGKVQAEELRGQLGEHLPGAFEIAADAMGVTTAQLDDMLKKGKVSATELLTKLPEALRKAYGEGLPGALQRSSVQIARMQNELKLFGSDIGNALEPAVASIANLGRSFIALFNNDSFKGFVGDLSKSFADVVNAIAGSFDLIQLHATGLVFDLAEIWDNISKGAQIAFWGLSGGLATILGGILDGFIGLGISIGSVFKGAVNEIKELWAGLLEKIATGAQYVGKTEMAAGLIADAAAIRNNINPAMDEYIAKMKGLASGGLTQGMLKVTGDKINALYEEWAANRKLSDQAEELFQKEFYQAKQKIALNAELSDAKKDFNQMTQEEIEAQKEAQKELDAMMKEGAKLTEQMYTPLEQYNATLANLDKLLQAGAISQETFNRASAKAAEDYKAALEKMTDAQKKFQKSVEDNNKEWAKLKEDVATPYEAMQQSLAELNKLEKETQELRKQGADVLVDEQTLMRARLKIQEEYHQKLVEMNEAFDWAGLMQDGLEGTADILSQYLVDPFNKSTDDIKKQFSDMLRNMAAQLLKSAFLQIFTKTFNLNGEQGQTGLGGLLGGLLGGKQQVQQTQQQQPGNAVGNVLGAMAGKQCNTECAAEAGNQIKMAMTTASQQTGQQINQAMQQSGGGFMAMFTETGQSLWGGLKNIFSSAQGGFSTTFTSLTNNLSGLFNSLPQILSGLFGGGGAAGGGGGTGLGGAVGGALMSSGNPYAMAAGALITAFAANGKVVEGGRIHAFADGGVVSGPTKFPLASGNFGLMGEAGPEAIMPLTRGADGKLAVNAEGSGVGNITIVNLMDEKLLAGYLKSDAAGRVIINQLSKNSSQVKAIARG